MKSLTTVFLDSNTTIASEALSNGVFTIDLGTELSEGRAVLFLSDRATAEALYSAALFAVQYFSPLLAP